MAIPADADKASQINSFQHRHFQKIKCAYRCINILNIVTAISLILLLKFTRVNLQTVYLILAALPLDIYAFSWIFHKVVIWKNPDKTGQRPAGYICLGIRSSLIILFFIDLLFVLYPLIFFSFQCVSGERYLNFTIFAIFAVLFLTTVLLHPRHAPDIKPNLDAYITIAGLTIAIAWTLAVAVFYAASKPKDQYAAVVLDSTISHNQGTHYYIFVRLKDGREQRFRIDADMYDYTQEHKAVLIRERTSFFDTVFVSVHNPITYMENQLERISKEK